jgi:hypothetical protein
MTLTGLKSLKSELAGLADLSRPQLQERWRRLYGCDAPEQISLQLLTQAVAYGMQVKSLGGINFTVRRALERATQENGSKPGTKSDPQGLKAGLVLVRVWHGETHQVTTLGDGIEYRGTRYRSLSEVALQITGTRWSGPRFFGLQAARKNRVAG